MLITGRTKNLTMVYHPISAPHRRKVDIHQAKDLIRKKGYFDTPAKYAAPKYGRN